MFNGLNGEINCTSCLSQSGNTFLGVTLRQIIIFFAVAAFAGCGVETATTAATVAAAKKQEVDQGKKTMEQVQQSVGKAMEQTQQSAERVDDAAK